MTPERMKEIRERIEKATPRPWSTFPEEHDFLENGRDKDGQIFTQILMGEDQCVNAECSYSWDAIFIAHARTDIPELLDEIERLKSEHNRLKIDDTNYGK
jgi:hypothetical protein